MCSRGRRVREQGFTLVELLITIVIAGLVFAAMVPVFVAAAQKSSNDRARILATNTVQSTIERLRDLPYDQLWDATAGTVGQSVQWKGPGSNLSVAVVPYPSNASRDSEKYLIATVTATWPNRSGADHVVRMKTAIYRQALATETLALFVHPSANGLIRPPVTVSAQVNAADAAKLLRIDFTVYANNGTVVQAWSVNTSDVVKGAATWSYDREWLAVDSANQPLADGRYSFMAKTVPNEDAGDPVPAPEWARREYVLDRDPPGESTLSACEPGFYKVSPTDSPQPFIYLNWQLDQNVSDLDHFEIRRTGTSPKTIILPKWAYEYVDRDVAPGGTYSYAVRAWDTQEQYAPWSDDPATLTLAAAQSDLTPLPPVGPVSYLLTNPGVTTQWTASANVPIVDAYRVYRRGTDGTVLLAGTLPVLDEAETRFSMDDISTEYGETYTYFVTAVLEADGYQWESTSISGPPLRVPEPPLAGMVVGVMVAPGAEPPMTATLMIHALDTGDFIPANPWEYPTIDLSNANHNTWTTGAVLYPGRYEVIAVFYGRNHVSLGTSTSNVVYISTPDTRVDVPYPGE
jgi:prepilin-type N-terminal cleavage/methylation domain-containing protein